jgi:hypothetical protein
MDAFSTEITDTLSLGSIVSNMLSVHSLNYSSTEQDQNITPATMTNLDSFIRSMASMNEEICIWVNQSYIHKEDKIVQEKVIVNVEDREHEFHLKFIGGTWGHGINNLEEK